MVTRLSAEGANPKVKPRVAKRMMIFIFQQIQLSETKADLEKLAYELNPIVGFYDPLELIDGDFWNQDQDFAIGWIRHAEIKHGRIAMAAFVGYCVQSNYHFPWSMTLDGSPFPATDLSPPEQWDVLPFATRIQIILFIGFLEAYSELTPGGPGDGLNRKSSLAHYTKGGQPGKFPEFGDVPHPVPFDLYDPFKLFTKMDKETKEKRLVMELNNGRLAMLGIFGFLTAQTIPGSVPLLANIVKPYTGEVMSPFEF